VSVGFIDREVGFDGAA